MKVELKFADGTPTSEFDAKFLQGMLDRMAMSFYKYGRVADAFPQKIDAIASADLRLKEFKRTGNLEMLMDAANFLMIEFMHPRHKKAHFKPTDSHESPGRKWVDEKNPNARPNVENFGPPVEL
jgi:hypothetical protein